MEKNLQLHQTVMPNIMQKVDLNIIGQPMIADPDVHNEDVSKRYTHDVIRPLSFYKGSKNVDLGFVGSCMVHKGDLKIVAKMLRNLESQQGMVRFNAGSN